MVEQVAQKSIAGYYYWSSEHPVTALELRADNTCTFYKAPESESDRPQCATGRAFNGHGTYEVVGDSVRISGKGKGYNFGYMWTTSADAIKAGPKDVDFDQTKTIEDLEKHRKGDAEGQILKIMDTLHWD